MAIKQVAGFSFPFPPLFSARELHRAQVNCQPLSTLLLAANNSANERMCQEHQWRHPSSKVSHFTRRVFTKSTVGAGEKTTLVFRFSFHFFSFVLLSERSARDEASRHADRRGQRNECNVETALPHAPPVREMHFFFHLFFFSAHLLPSRFNQLITDSKTWLPPSVNFRERCYPITAAQTKSSGFHWQWAVVNKSNLLSMKSLKAHVFIFFIFF